MKVQCDACEKAPASLFCCADEAALCEECDVRIHAANKLAGKHQRVPLILQSPSNAPRCDICQERSAYIFCLEDRALLCRECDVPIHSSTTLATKHQRFLVAGIQVALGTIEGGAITAATTTTTNTTNQQTEIAKTQAMPLVSSSGTTKNACKKERNVVVSNSSAAPPPALDIAKTSNNSTPLHSPTISFQRFPSKSGSMIVPTLTNIHNLDSTANQPQHQKKEDANNDNDNFRENITKRSTISEYLTESIPGWKMEDFFGMASMSSCFDVVGDVTSSKADEACYGESDWASELKLFDEEMNSDHSCEIAAVPQLPSPPTLSGLSRGKSSFSIKSKRYDCMFDLSWDEGGDVSIVPDMGLSSSPTALPYPKRPRHAH